METDEKLNAALEEIVVPLLKIDGATLHVVKVTASEVHLHLGGEYAGCPGVEFVERSLLAPLVAGAIPSAELKVTKGYPLPRGARLVASER